MSTDMLAYALGPTQNPMGLPASPYQVGADIGNAAAGGMQAYQLSAQHSQQMRQAAADLARTLQQTQEQDTTFKEQQNAQKLAATQGAYNLARQRGDTDAQQAFSAQIPALFNAATGANVPMPKPVVGMPVGGTPAQPAVPSQTFTPSGPTESGAPLGQFSTMPQDAKPATPPHMDLTNKQSQDAMDAMTYQFPTIRTAKNGEVDYLYDPKTHQTTVLQSNQLHLTPEQQILRESMREDAKKEVANIQVKGRLDAAQIAASSHMAVSQYMAGAAGKRLAATLAARNLDPSRRVLALAGAAKDLAGATDPTDVNGDGHRAVLRGIFDELNAANPMAGAATPGPYNPAQHPAPIKAPVRINPLPPVKAAPAAPQDGADGADSF